MHSPTDKDYPAFLRPIAIETFIIDGNVIEIPKALIHLKKWEGTPFANTFGGKPLIDSNGIPMFAELAIMKIFINAGWQARWIETYGAKSTNPYHFSDWIDGKLSEQMADKIQDPALINLLNAISVSNLNSYSGCWDIVAWHKDLTIFAESKRVKKDSIRQTQNKWLSAGLKHGLSVSNFLVVQWDFEKQS